MRKLIGLLVLLAILVGIDRGSAALAGNAIAQRAQDSQHLATRPEVSVQGFPFLTQVVGGRYTEVTARLTGVSTQGPRLTEVDVRAYDVRVPLGDILGGRVEQVLVGHAAGTVLIGYPDLNAYLAREVGGVTGGAAQVSAKDDGGRVRLTGSVQIPVIGRQSASGDADLSVQGNQVTLRPAFIDIAGPVLPDYLKGLAVDALTIHLSLRGLPFGVRLTSVTAAPDGLRLNGSADGLVVSPSGATARSGG